MKKNEKFSIRFDFFIYTLIILNILAMILESHVAIKNRYDIFFFKV